MNTQLRLHMEKADVVNKALREDVDKLTVDWSRARDELMRKESQWRMEQEVGGPGGGASVHYPGQRAEGFTLRLGWKAGCHPEVSDQTYHSCWQLPCLGGPRSSALTCLVEVLLADDMTLKATLFLKK